MSMKKINLYISEEQLAILEAERDRVGVPVAEQIRRAIDENILSKYKKEPKREGVVES